MWKVIADKLHELRQESGLDTPYRDSTKVKTKYFNLSKKYKQAKDKTRVSGEGSEAIDDCPHFEDFDEFMGSRDIISPKYVVESGTSCSTSSSTQSTGTESSHNTSTTSENSICPSDNSENMDESEDARDAPTRAISKGKAPAKRPRSEEPIPTSKPNKKRKTRRDESENEDKWLQLFQEQNEMMRESQKREKELFERLQGSEESCKDLIVGAIRELGSLFKKD